MNWVGFIAIENLWFIHICRDLHLFEKSVQIQDPLSFCIRLIEISLLFIAWFEQNNVKSENLEFFFTFEKV